MLRCQYPRGRLGIAQTQTEPTFPAKARKAEQEQPLLPSDLTVMMIINQHSYLSTSLLLPVVLITE